jgi:hypothetical protein
MWRTRARRDRRPYVDGQPCPDQTAGGSVGGGDRAIQAKSQARGSCQRLHLAGREAELHLLHVAGEPLSSPRMLEEEAGYWPMREAEPGLGSPSAPARMMNILEAEGRREAAARLASPHHEAGGHPSGWP